MSQFANYALECNFRSNDDECRRGSFPESVATAAHDRFRHSVFHRYRQHHRHRHFHESRFPVGGHSIRVRATHALGGRRNRRALRRALLRRTERRAAAFRRRISFSLADLSSLSRVHGRFCFRYGWFRRAHRTRGHGFWKIFRRSLRRRFTGRYVVCHCVAGCGVSFREFESRQRVPKSFHTREVASDRHAHHRWVLRSGEAANDLHPSTC